MNGIVTALTANGMSWGERFSVAGTVTLEGMLVIFCVLALLWGVIELMHKFLYREPQGTTTPETPAATTAPATTAEFEETASDEDDIVAAIVAAITAMRAENGKSGGFRVVSFRRTRMN